MIKKMKEEIGKKIVGQEEMIDKILIGLITGNHILLEGLPGLAKSLTVNTMAETLGLKFSRIQFTPDLLPSDIIGTEIYNEKTGEFHIKKGPIFANIILADEINRAPAKVQSALLEAMQEKQVTIANETYKLEEP
ncbi:MAG: AAA family ATPase, partial [Fusobacteriaceae bacterium]